MKILSIFNEIISDFLRILNEFQHLASILIFIKELIQKHLTFNHSNESFKYCDQINAGRSIKQRKNLDVDFKNLINNRLYNYL